MRAEIWFYEGHSEDSDPVLIKSFLWVPKAVHLPDGDWECGNLRSEDCSLADQWKSVAENIGIALVKIGEV